MNVLKYLCFAFCAIICSGLLSSCSEDVEVVADTNINYTLVVSPDLLKFVTPQVSYVDENGVLVTITGVEELDRKVIESRAESSQNNGGTEVYASVWTQQVVTGTGYKCWTVTMKFRHLNFHSRMQVKYLINDLVENTSGRVYDFHHSVNTSISLTKSTITKKKGIVSSESTDVKAYGDSHVSITVGDYHAGDDVNIYLDNLKTTPDKVGYYINSNGDVIRDDVFDM